MKCKKLSKGLLLGLSILFASMSTYSEAKPCRATTAGAAVGLALSIPCLFVSYKILAEKLEFQVQLQFMKYGFPLPLKIRLAMLGGTLVVLLLSHVTMTATGAVLGSSFSTLGMHEQPDVAETKKANLLKKVCSIAGAGIGGAVALAPAMAMLVYGAKNADLVSNVFSGVHRDRVFNVVQYAHMAAPLMAGMIAGHRAGNAIGGKLVQKFNI